VSQPLPRDVDEAAVELLPSLHERGDAPARRIPVPLNTLIGREQEFAAIGRLLERDDVRLITLTGPGGVGKTRLALALAEAADETYADGVIFVPLAPVQDVALIPAAIADRLDVQESGDRPLVDELIARIRGERCLLVLDNFEHLLAAVPVVTELLRGCPGLKILATSRRRLGLSGEHEVPVLPLAVADPRQSLTVEQLAAVPAIQLFVARAQAAAPGFALTAANGRQVAEICQRLDGLPLAIELAAPRTRLLSPAALLVRLTNRLQLLTDGPRDVEERLQTMRRAIDWSYDLLDPSARALHRRLAVFVGGFSLEAADWISGEGRGGAEGRNRADETAPATSLAPSPSSDTLDLVAALLDESLLQSTEQPDGERRFVMLETVREYALEQLRETTEEAVARRRHAGYCLRLAEDADPWQAAPQPWLDSVQAEHDNLRAGLSWSIEHDPETALRLASALWRFWSERGYWSEGRGWLARALAAGPDVAPAVRAAALGGAGTLAVDQGDFALASNCFAESLALAQETGDERRATRALRSLGIVASSQNELDRAEELFAEALLRVRALQDEAAIGRCLCDLGLVATRRGDCQRAIAFYEEALPIGRSTGDRAFTAILLSNLAGAYMDADDWARGEAMTAEALDQSRMLDDRFGAAINLHNLADCVFRRGDAVGAWHHYGESLRISHELGQRPLASRTLDRIADLLARASLWRPAVHLLGAAAAQRQAIGDELFPVEEEYVAATIATTRAALSAEAFQAAWEAGAALSLDQAVAEALALDVPPAIAAEQGAARRAVELGLTTREVEVLRLVAAGWADKEIATTLAISRHTASKHVASVRAKLAAPSRTAAVAAAREAGIL
jgi:predicted ATPase/DNA-binding CsgD family transcriptional regulator